MTSDRSVSFDVVGTGFTVLDRIYTDGDLAGEALGGSCGNVLLSLAMLERRVAPLLLLGLDTTGERLLGEFKRAGADVRYINRRRDVRSPILTQDLDTSSGRHSFSFVCRETNVRFPNYQPIRDDDVASAGHALSACSVFYADRLSSGVLQAMRQAHATGAIIYFEPSVKDDPLFDDALPLATILKYSSDRLGDEEGEAIVASGVISIVTHGSAGLEIRRGRSSLRCEAAPVDYVTDACGSGDMVSVGLIDWLLSRAPVGRDLSTYDVLEGVRAGQRLAAANCAFAGARGLFHHLGVAHARRILSSHRQEPLLGSEELAYGHSGTPELAADFHEQCAEHVSPHPVDLTP